jgi:transcriptional regulator with XRE-family HTH domain
MKEMKDKKIQNPEFRKEYKRVKEEMQVASQIIKLRVKSNMTQQQLAEKMDTSQSAVVRLEGGNQTTSVRTLLKAAKALNCKLEIKFIPK